MAVREDSTRDRAERFVISSAKERWLEFLPHEHATLPLPLDFAREGEDLVVRRGLRRGRPVSHGRIPKDCAAPLFLQAAAAASWLQACGQWLDEEDLAESSWDVEAGTPRLWLPATPASLRR